MHNVKRSTMLVRLLPATLVLQCVLKLHIANKPLVSGKDYFQLIPVCITSFVLAAADVVEIAYDPQGSLRC